MPKKILFIEDEEDLLMLLQVRLEASGYVCITAKDGVEGLEKARAQKPDLIILDLLLPKMDGYMVFRNLRGNEDTKKIPIIVLTAVGQREAEDRCKKLGVDAFVAKPFEPPVLLGKIKELLK